MSALVSVCALVLVACTSTMPGSPSMAPIPDGSDGAIVALMDTGPYQVSPVAPLGSAGDDGPLFEARRIAEYVVGPWQTDVALRKVESPGDIKSLPIASSDPQLLSNSLPVWFTYIVISHRAIAGFSTFRVKDDSIKGNSGATSLLNVVLRFTDSDAANAVVTEALDTFAAEPTFKRLSISTNPEAVAFANSLTRDLVFSHSVSAHGAYVLFQELTAEPGKGIDRYLLSELAIGDILHKQIRLIDQFQPTELEKLPDLPKDPSGELLARTLPAPDARGPAIMGVWRPEAWLHFEDDPVTASAFFKDGGVEWVSQRLGTVYQAGDRDGARKVINGITATMTASLNVREISGVAGLPNARCFERTFGAVPATDAISYQRVMWHFKCIAQAGRYAFTTFSDTERDVKQQISAQYRILAGE